MDILIKAIKQSVRHLESIDKVLSTFNHSEKDEYLKNRSQIRKCNTAYEDRFSDVLYYGGSGRQMILNDIFEYIFSARGYYYMWGKEDIARKQIFVKIALHFINQLMIMESISVNHDLRNEVLKSLKKKIGVRDFFLDSHAKKIHNALLKFKGDVHFDTATSNKVGDSVIERLEVEDSEAALKDFDKYSDSLLPKIPHGLWRELIVYIQLLRINAGYILPLLLNQRILSKYDYLKPPDFLVIRNDGTLIGVEVGAGKEAQTGNFSTELGCQMVTAQNTNIPPRCPICGKWVLFCQKVIEDYANLDDPLFYIHDDIRCAHDCNIFTYNQVIKGKCPYVKYRGRIKSTSKPRQRIKYTSSYHYHYSCILKSGDSIALSEIRRQKQRWEKHLASRHTIAETTRSMTINCLKTNYPFFDGLENLRYDSKENMKCFGTFLGNKNCNLCALEKDCRRTQQLDAIIREREGQILQDNEGN